MLNMNVAPISLSPIPKEGYNEEMSVIVIQLKKPM
jgi:hypothetical protein